MGSYLRQRVGSIADWRYQPVPLLAHPGLDDLVPLDLTHSSLRSVSPIHREYMQNTHVAASLTIGLADGERLWGMLVCHNMTPRIASPERRTAAAVAGKNCPQPQTSGRCNRPSADTEHPGEPAPQAIRRRFLSPLRFQSLPQQGKALLVDFESVGNQPNLSVERRQASDPAIVDPVEDNPVMVP